MFLFISVANNGVCNSDEMHYNHKDIENQDSCENQNDSESLSHISTNLSDMTLLVCLCNFFYNYIEYLVHMHGLYTKHITDIIKIFMISLNVIV